MIYKNFDWLRVGFGVFIHFDMGYARLSIGPLEITFLWNEIKNNGDDK